MRTTRRAFIKSAEKELGKAILAHEAGQRDVKRQSTRGRLELVLADADALDALKQRWIDAELAKALSISDAKARSEVMKRLEEIMQEQGVMVQPYWRSIYRHFDPKVKGADMHATFEHHHYKWSIAAA